MKTLKVKTAEGNKGMCVLKKISSKIAGIGLAFCVFNF